MTQDSWSGSTVPENEVLLREIDTSVAHPARIYDYWLGGSFL